MLNRPHHMLMLAPVDVLDGMSRIIHMANAFCEAGTKVTLVTAPQINDNAQQLSRLLHRNASVYVARFDADRQMLVQRLAGKLAEEEHLPEVMIYDLMRIFQPAAKKSLENAPSSLTLLKKMSPRLHRLMHMIFDEETAKRRKYFREVVSSSVYEKYKDLVQLYPHNLGFLFQALAIHQSIEPIDAIFCHDLWSLPIGCIMKDMFDISLLYDAHEICTWCFENPIHRSIAIGNEKWMYEMCDAFITTTEGMADYYRKLSPALLPLVVTNAHRELWHKPANLLTWKERLSLPADTPLIAFVGNLYSASHIDRIIKAISVCQTNFHLAIIGDRGEVEHYKELTKTLNLENRVFFLGRMDFESVFSTIYGADFGIIPNLQNYLNPPNVVLSSKFFDYAQVELPIISDLCSEVQKVFEQFHIGEMKNLQLPTSEVASMLDNFYARVIAGDFSAAERRRAKESLIWPNDLVNQILSAQYVAR